jgi:hypothetical protein
MQTFREEKWASRAHAPRGDGRDSGRGPGAWLLNLAAERENAMGNFVDNYFWVIMVGGIVLLIALVGLLLFLRNQNPD